VPRAAEIDVNLLTGLKADCFQFPP